MGRLRHVSHCSDWSGGTWRWMQKRSRNGLAKLVEGGKLPNEVPAELATGGRESEGY